MNEKWPELRDKFANISKREQMLILVAGLFVIIMLFYSFSIGGNMADGNKRTSQTKTLKLSSTGLQPSIDELEAMLLLDPNESVKSQIAHYEKELAAIDKKLLTLTSELINPIQMRKALLKLLKLQPGVSLTSFELLGVEPVLLAKHNEGQNKEDKNENGVNNKVDNTLNLYRHGIRIKLTGRYFQLRDYLRELESLSWTFFWQGFNYQVNEYPQSELVIDIYSLSTKKEFIGV